jgi:hypothetical protein
MCYSFLVVHCIRDVAAAKAQIKGFLHTKLDSHYILDSDNDQRDNQDDKPNDGDGEPMIRWSQCGEMNIAAYFTKIFSDLQLEASFKNPDAVW